MSQPETHGIGLSNPQLSKGRRKMLDLVNRLHSTGVQVDLDLPVIAVIGNQSAGKSSLIESISGVTLPRAAGTCTRCPTECKLSYSTDGWKCIVSLRFLTDDKGQNLGQARTVLFGEPIFEKSLVEERIRRAQRAILNPSVEPHLFLEGSDVDPPHRQLTFSSNCVSLQISGEDVADLSFVDLPGLIANTTTGGNKGDIKLIENLVKQYIERPSCIILLTIACETDFNNQGAYEFVKEIDTERARTIGVLTKPDRIPTGDEDNWLSLIRNETEPLIHNWYCVKQPDGTALKKGITWEEARRDENDFFAMTSPWNSLDGLYQKYLRTANLTERLSSVLSDLIAKRLPQIQEELERLLGETETKLRQLPRPPSSDPFSEILSLIHLFIRDLERHVEGIPHKDGLMQQIRPAQQNFRKAIRATAPNFRPYEARFASSRKFQADPKFLENEEEIDDPDTSESPTSQDAIYIDEVMQQATEARTRELPDNFPFVVQHIFISKVVSKWPEPAHELFEWVHSAVTHYARKLIKDRFETFGRGELHQRILLVMTNHIKKCCEQTKQRIDWLVRLEQRPFTLNEHHYLDYRQKFAAHYRGWRQEDNNTTFMAHVRRYRSKHTFDATTPTPVAKVMSALAEMSLRPNPTQLAALLPTDSMDPAINIMAGVRAYFQVAYNRFADYIVLAIDDELVHGLQRNVETALNAGLGITGPDAQRICMELVQEHPSVSLRREELTKRVERLRMASQELVQVGL